MKKMFYYTDVLPFLAEGDKAIDKLNRNLEIFYENKDKIRLIWHPWSGTEKYLKLNNSEVLDKYLAVVDKYNADGWGDMDRSPSFDEAKEVLLGCNAYYGDVCDLVYEAQNEKIPVMIQSLDV